LPKIAIGQSTGGVMSPRSRIAKPSDRPDRNVGYAASRSGGSTTLGLGIGSLVATVIPFGHLLAPFIGGAALAYGIWQIRAGRSDDRTVLGTILGAIGLLASLTLIFILRNVLWRVFTQIQ
jgi:hypothetical protein